MDLGSSTDMMGVGRENVNQVLETPITDGTCSRSLQWGGERVRQPDVMCLRRAGSSGRGSEGRDGSLPDPQACALQAVRQQPSEAVSSGERKIVYGMKMKRTFRKEVESLGFGDKIRVPLSQ